MKQVSIITVEPNNYIVGCFEGRITSQELEAKLRADPELFANFSERPIDDTVTFEHHPHSLCVGYVWRETDVLHINYARVLDKKA